VTGDEWGLVEVVPAENREHYAEMARRFAEHHKDTKFGPNGWATPPFILRGPAVPLSVRATRPEFLTQAFANIFVPTDRVTTCVDFTGPPFPAEGCIAWKRPADSAFSAGFYGSVTNGILESLWWSPHRLDRPDSESLADVLALIGKSHQLLLAVEADGVIDFEDRETMVKYLSMDEE
jgi:hypothetical protein